MSQGVKGHVGIGQESTFKTGVAPDIFFPATENIKRGIARLRDTNPKGHILGASSSDPGAFDISGPLSSIHAYPDILSHLFYAFFGSVATTGAGPYEHTFVPSSADVAAGQALPGYSVQVTKGAKTQRSEGGQLNKLTLTQETRERLIINTEWMFADYDDGQSAATPSMPTTTPLRFAHAAFDRATADFNVVKRWQLEMSRNIIAVPYIDGTDKVSDFCLGDFSAVLNMTLAFRNTSEMTDYLANTKRAWDFDWVNGNDHLKIDIPQLTLTDVGDPLSGPGELSVEVSAEVEYNASAGYALQALVKNGVADPSA